MTHIMICPKCNNDTFKVIEGFDEESWVTLKCTKCGSDESAYGMKFGGCETTLKIREAEKL